MSTRRGAKAGDVVVRRKKMKILDDAFELALNADGANSHAEAKDRLQAKYPQVQWEEIVSFYLRACALVDACYGIGDACRGKKFTDEMAMSYMKKKFPGFSKATYTAALAYAYFIGR